MICASSMARTPYTSVIPPGGYHFVDTSTGVPVKIEGDSYDDVADRVLRFRLANSKAPGNPAQELIDYVCGTWPHFCSADSAKVPAVATRTNRHLSTRVAGWIAAFYTFARADAGAPSSESARRAGICAECSENKEFRNGGCGSCISSIKRLFFVFRRDRAVPLEEKLGACNIIGQHNGCAVLAASLPPLSVEIEARLPAACWRREGSP